MTITFDFENKPEQSATIQTADQSSNSLQGYTEYLMTKYRLITIDDEKLKNLVKNTERLRHTGELRTPPIRQSWATSVGTNYVVSLFPKKNNYVAVITKETFLRPIKRTQKTRTARNRERKFKRKYPNTKFIDFAAEKRQQIWHAAGRLESKSSRFPEYVAKIRKKTIEEAKQVLSTNGERVRTLTEVIRASADEFTRRDPNRIQEPIKKKPRSLVINGELITMGSFFPDDYDEKFNIWLRLFKLRKLLKRKFKKVLVRHDMPTSPEQAAWIARNATSRMFSTTLPTVSRRSYKHNIYNFKRFIRRLRYPKTQVLAWSTAGKMGFEGPKRPTPYANQVLGKYICAQLALKEIRFINLRLYTRINKNVRSFIRGLHMTKEHEAPVRIHKIVIPLVFTHGSIRRRKQRRV